MSSGTVNATSTYSPGKGMSFAKDIGSRVLAAAQSAKNEKKLQEKIEAEGGEVPESAKKGLFGRALKQEFVTNPINDLKKSFNKKLSGAANAVGFFGSKGRALEDKMLGKKISIKKGGFDRSGYKRAQGDDDDSGGVGGGGGAGGGGVATLGALVLDVQAIASAVSSMQGLINTQMIISSKMSDSLGEIKTILGEQVSIQQQRIENEERAAMEASLEASQQVSGTSKATSTLTEGGGLLGMLGDLQSLFGILKSLPAMFMGLLKGILSKIPGGKFLLDKFGGNAAKKAAGEVAETGAKGLLGKILRPIFKRIPVIGGLIDFAVSLALGEPVGRAAAKAAGAMLGGALGGIIGSVVPGPGTFVGGLLGGIAGDWVGSSLYDAITGAFGAKSEEKMASGGVMIGEAGKEAVVDLNSAEGKSQLGGGSSAVDSAGQSYYGAIAGSTLAVTKEFIEGMGPIGAAVAPVIQDDIAKLGQTFELPATAIKMSVGGAGLQPVAGAEKKGEKFLEKLVTGSLEKIGKKKEKGKTSGGGGGGGDGTPPGTDPPPAPPAPPGNVNQPTGGGKSNFTFGDSIASGLVGRQGANGQTVMDASGISKVGASPADVLGQLQAFDQSKLKGKTVRLSSGITNNPSDLKSVEDQIKYLVSVGAKVQLVGVTNTPPQKGTTYGHLEKSLAGMNDKLSALAAKYADKGVMFLGGFKPGSDGIHPANASELNSSYNVDVQPGGKVGAASGITVTSNGNGGNKRMEPGQTYGFDSLHAHHSDEGRMRVYKGVETGVPKDYGMGVAPHYMPSGPNGQIPLPVAGKVLTREWDKQTGYGRTVIVETNLGKMQFSHLSKFGKFEVGDQLSAGTIIGVQGGSGSTETTYAEHLHLNASKKGHEAFVNFITSGKPTTGVTSDDTDSPGNEDEGNNQSEPEDPFTAMESGLKEMLAGAMVMGGNPKDKAEFDKLLKEANESTAVTNMFSTGNVTTPTTAPPSQNQRGRIATGASATPTPSVVHVPVGSSSPSSLSGTANPGAGTPHALVPLRPA